jgi:hypothetical protein
VYFFIRKHDPSRAKWCIVAGSISSVSWLFVFVAVIVATSPSEPVPPMPGAVENDIRLDNPESSNEGKNQLNPQAEETNKMWENIRESMRMAREAITKPLIRK